MTPTLVDPSSPLHAPLLRRARCRCRWRSSCWDRCRWPPVGWQRSCQEGCPGPGCLRAARAVGGGGGGASAPKPPPSSPAIGSRSRPSARARAPHTAASAPPPPGGLRRAQAACSACLGGLGGGVGRTVSGGLTREEAKGLDVEARHLAGHHREVFHAYDVGHPKRVPHHRVRVQQRLVLRPPRVRTGKRGSGRCRR